MNISVTESLKKLLMHLTKVNGLKVIARTSAFVFKGKNIDVREIGKQLGVSTVLEGSVRKYSNRAKDNISVN